MKILFEEYGYKTETIKDILGDFLLSKLDMERERQYLGYVGYFYSNTIKNKDGSKGDLVFILPKVLLDEDGMIFGIEPEKVINLNFKDWKRNKDLLPDGKHSKLQIFNFIYGFVVWIYRSVNIYRQKLPRNGEEEIDQGIMSSLQVGKGHKSNEATFVDILLALLDFQKTHKDFITYAIKLSHSGFNKTSWSRTVARTQAVVQDGSPIYLNPINKTKIVNYDEELLIIYYSILNHIHEEYGFPISNQPGYKLIKGAMFDGYLKSMGKVKLHKIRYKYYSDTALYLWNLCYAFFDQSDSIRGSANKRDYLLVNKFETVFEGMIDELIGDKNLPKGLKNQDDSKRIDHLFTHDYLLENLEDYSNLSPHYEIYNIADSKYYRRDKDLRGHDVPKQFTYARNVIQWHMDLLHDLLEDENLRTHPYKEIPLFDSLTEGYNIIPNFFISAQVNENLNYDEQDLSPSRLGLKTNEGDGGKGNVHESYFFWERLFDRNSYFTLHYDVNFLYVIKMYAKNKHYDKSRWKQEVRKKFRRGILDYLNSEYNFYQILVPEYYLSEFIESHYRRVAGKVFSFENSQGRRIMVYAERKDQVNGKGKSYIFDSNTDSYVDKSDNSIVIKGKDGERRYKIISIKLGEDNYVNTERLIYLPNVNYILPAKNERDYKLRMEATAPISLRKAAEETYVLVGYYGSKEHLEWIVNNRMYNTRVGERGAKHVKIDPPRLYAKYLILYNKDFGSSVYRIKSVYPYLMSKQDFPKGDYTPKSADYYLMYDLDLECEIEEPLEILVKSRRFGQLAEMKKPLGFKLAKLKFNFDDKPLAELKYRFEEYEEFIDLVADDYAKYYSDL